jgi:DNA helicase-4
MKPELAFVQLVERAMSTNCAHLLSQDQLSAAKFAASDLDSYVAGLNEQITTLEIKDRRPFFDSIERTPLSEEQARAVICFDNRVQILAAAGSGKTSTMVAKAAYAVARGLVPPDRILLLAFNKAAAAELQERIESRFAAVGIPSDGIRSSTFHSFGLDVIGRATQRKPRLARWLEQGEEIEMVMTIVDGLLDQSSTFSYNWDRYRLLFANASAPFDNTQPDGYDSGTKAIGYRTASGVLVKSVGERLVADFLFYNGVPFIYEHPYAHDMADATHSQYRPDFYYPDIEAWHEHWALDRDGNPPKEFAGYREGMRWKQEVHRRYGTSLIETTWSNVVFNDGLQRLGDELTRRASLSTGNLIGQSKIPGTENCDTRISLVSSAPLCATSSPIRGRRLTSSRG